MGKVIFNNFDPAYIQLKYKNKLTIEDGQQANSIINLVADKINIISKLRIIFAKYSLDLLEPDLIVLDEFHRIGVENTRLDSYIFDLDRSGAEWYDLVVLRPDPSILQSILELSEDKLGSWYDNLSALRQWLWLPNTFNNKYNCVELVTQSIEFDDTEKVYYWDEWDYSFLWKTYHRNCIKIWKHSIR